MRPTAALVSGCEELEAAIFWKRVQSRKEPPFLLMYSLDPALELANYSAECESVLFSLRAALSVALKQRHESQRVIDRQRATIASLREALRTARPTEGRAA